VVNALLIDLDGVLYEGETAVDGAAESVAALRDRGISQLFLTNTTSRPRKAIVEKLAGMGLDVAADNLLTPPVAAARWLRRHVTGAVALFVDPATAGDFGDLPVAEKDDAEVGAVVDLAYYTPREGTVYWFDGIFVPADAPHPGNAHRFLNYLLRPQVIAAISNETRYANANRASLPWLDPAVASDPAVYPPMAERAEAVLGYIFGPKEERRRTRAWSRVKTGL